MGTPRLISVALLAAVAVLSACESSTGENDKGGGPLPQPRAGETYPGDRTEVAGRVIVDRGCFLVEVNGSTRLAVWPLGSDYARDDASVVVLPDGIRVGDGARVRADAVAVPVPSLAGYPDGYWGQQVAFCTPDVDEVLVMDAVAIG